MDYYFSSKFKGTYYVPNEMLVQMCIHMTYLSFIRFGFSLSENLTNIHVSNLLAIKKFSTISVCIFYRYIFLLFYLAYSITTYTSNYYLYYNYNYYIILYYILYYIIIIL